MDFKILKDYLPLMTTLLAASLTYFFGYKKGKNEKFTSQLEDNLSNIISPLFHAMKKINEEESLFQREKLIREFFAKYTSEGTSIYKISNKSILDWFYDTYDFYLIFVKDKSDENWENFWVYFNELYHKVRVEYKNVRGIIYSDYKWYSTLVQKNYLLRALVEILAFIYETVKFFIASCLFIIAIAVFQRFEGTTLIPAEFTKVVLELLFIFLMICCFLTIVLSDYFSSKQAQKDSFLKILFQKLFPTISEKWNRTFEFNLEKEN